MTAPAPNPEGTITIAGRTFTYGSRKTSLRQDLYVTGLVRDAGIDHLLVHGLDRRDPKSAEIAMEVTLKAYKAGVLFQLLAALLHTPGEKWTAEATDERAQWLADQEEDTDKAAIRALLLLLLVAFFESATAAFKPSPTSSLEVVATPSSSDASPNPSDAVPSTSETGTPSSDSWEGTTPMPTSAS